MGTPVKERVARWRRNNPDKAKEYGRRYWRTANQIYAGMKARAKARGISVGITQQEWLTLVTDAVCYYCMGPLPKAGSGIDRLDHLKDYVLGNVVPCCRKCNWRKGALEAAGLRYPRTVEVLREILRCL